MNTRLWPYGQKPLEKVSGILISVAEDGMYVLGQPLNDWTSSYSFALFLISKHVEEEQRRSKQLEAYVHRFLPKPSKGEKALLLEPQPSAEKPSSVTIRQCSGSDSEELEQSVEGMSIS